MPGASIAKKHDHPWQLLPDWTTEVSIKFTTKICTETILPISNYLSFMYQLQLVVNSDVKEGLEGCLITWFDLFYHCVAKSPHIQTEVSIKFSTKICTEIFLPMSNYLSFMYQLQLVVNSDVKEGSEGCLITWFKLFLPLCGQLPPHPNRSLHQFLNQDLHRNNFTNVKLPFLYVSTTIGCQLWCERRLRRVPNHTIWAFFATVWPNPPTSKQKSPSSSQPRSAQK